MEITYYLFSNNVKCEDRLDKQGKYLEFIYFEDHLYPHLLKNQCKLEAIFLMSNKFNNIDEKKLKKLKITYEKMTDLPILKLTSYDLNSDNTRKFLTFYSSHNGELNAFYQFSDKGVLKEIGQLFAKPFKSQKLNKNNLRLSVSDLTYLNTLINKIPEESFLISSADDENYYYIFSNEKHLTVILDLLTHKTN